VHGEEDAFLLRPRDETLRVRGVHREGGELLVGEAERPPRLAAVGRPEDAVLLARRDVALGARGIGRQREQLVVLAEGAERLLLDRDSLVELLPLLAAVRAPHQPTAP